MDKAARRVFNENRKINWISVAWVLLSVTFIASGILKGISVKGFALTVREFLNLLGLETFQSHSFLIAVLMCIFETLIGLLGFIKKLRPILCLIYPIVMLFFTIITYINLTDIYGGIESCGCFGEIIHLNPMETFVKNLLLFGISIIILYSSLVLNSHAEGAEGQSISMINYHENRL